MRPVPQRGGTGRGSPGRRDCSRGKGGTGDGWERGQGSAMAGPGAHLRRESHGPDVDTRAPSRSLGHPHGDGLCDPGLWHRMVEAGAPAAISTREPPAVPHWQGSAPCRCPEARAEGHRGVGRGREGACEHRSGQPRRRAPRAASFPRNAATGYEARGTDRLSRDAWAGGARKRARHVRCWQGVAHRRWQAAPPAPENTALPTQDGRSATIGAWHDLGVGVRGCGLLGGAWLSVGGVDSSTPEWCLPPVRGDARQRRERLPKPGTSGYPVHVTRGTPRGVEAGDGGPGKLNRQPALWACPYREHPEG